MPKRRSAVRELLETAVLTIAIFLVVRVALQNFKVEGESMTPNLQNGEYILVNKVDYMLHAPHRGDIIVFRAVPAGQPDKDFIKRVIGLPGETVAVHNDAVFINNHKLTEPYIDAAHRPTYTFGPAVVPKNDYFVLGDNRNDSQDSHLWRWLPKQYIIGKAWISYWPPKELHVFQADAIGHLTAAIGGVNG
ncbi:MAG TPA: signal peptidase I [Chloroflexota bacterium]